MIPADIGKGGARKGAPFFYVPTQDVVGKHRGKRGVVIASGPSLSDFDFSLLTQDDLITIAVNEEGHRIKDRHIPDYWIFNDATFTDRLLDNGYLPHEDTQLVISSAVVGWLSARHATLPETKHPPIMYSPRAQFDPDDPIRYALRRTTSTAAISHLFLTGIRDIWLGGVDLCYLLDQSYYHDGHPQRMPLKADKLNSVQVSDGIWCTQKNLDMMTDVTILVKSLGDANTSITQGCLHSPLDCCEKKDFKDWYGR